jgi:transmembrane protein TMEM260 (protein O-mannosyltransferase)
MQNSEIPAMQKKTCSTFCNLTAGAALLTGLLSFVVYFRTLAPSIFWGDGIELSSVCATGGIAHPTGYPLFTILGRISICFFPLNQAFGTNLSCALYGALSSVFAFFMLKKALSFLNDDLFINPAFRDITALSGALLLAFSKTFWFHSTITEVYTLHILFITILLWLFLSYLKDEKRAVFIAFFAFWGLAFSNHMLSLTLSPLALVMIFHFFRSKEKNKIKTTLIASVLFLTGLSLYLYLIIQAKSRPELNWGDPSNLKNFFWVISGGDFKKYQFLMAKPGVPFTFNTFIFHVISRGTGLSKWLMEEIFNFSKYSAGGLKELGFLVYLIIIITGIITIAKQNKEALFGIIATVLFGLIMIFLYNIPDIEAYFMSLYPLLIILLFTGIISLSHITEMKYFKRKINYLPLLLLALPLLAFNSNFKSQDKSMNTDAMKYGLKIMENVPKNSIILTFGDNDIYILWYLQKVRGLRPDITVVGANFIHNGWYAAYFEKAGKDGPQIKIKDSPVPRSKEDFYFDLMSWAINPNIGKYPIFLTASDEILAKNYDVKIAARLLDMEDYERSSTSYLPQPYLYRLKKKSVRF